MKATQPDVKLSQALRNPVLIKLTETAARFTGLGLIALLPDGEGGQQVSLGGSVQRPLFCRIIQSSREGAKQCKLCHILMAVAANREGIRERRCHAGLSALVSPVAPMQENQVVVVSTCLFKAGDRAEIWKIARERGMQLKLDLKCLREAFDALPEISNSKLELAQSLMEIVAQTIVEIEARHKAEEKLAAVHAPAGSALQLQAAMQQELRGRKRSAKTKGAEPGAAEAKAEQCPALIKVVSDLIVHRPNMPYSVAAIAAAARITPNHFSALFLRWTGQGFTDYLNAQRIAAAQVLLRDLSLSISEIAYRTGFKDANYFARRFKLATGTTPRAWRNALPS